MEDLRTREGVAAYVEQRHAEMRDVLAADATAFTPCAWLWIRARPDTGEKLEEPQTMRLLVPPGATLDMAIASIRALALKCNALGVCVMLPLVIMDELPFGGVMLPVPRAEDLRLAFFVEHMDGKIGQALWTATVVQHGGSVEVGPLVEDPAGYKALGGLGELLPRRGMN